MISEEIEAVDKDGACRFGLQRNWSLGTDTSRGGSLGCVREREVTGGLKEGSECLCCLVSLLGNSHLDLTVTPLAFGHSAGECFQSHCAPRPQRHGERPSRTHGSHILALSWKKWNRERDGTELPNAFPCGTKPPILEDVKRGTRKRRWLNLTSQLYADGTRELFIFRGNFQNDSEKEMTNQVCQIHFLKTGIKR